MSKNTYLVIALLIAVGVGAYAFGSAKSDADKTPTITPTPTVTTTILPTTQMPTMTATPTVTGTLTPTPTVTSTVTPTATPATTQKKVVLTVKNATDKYEITIDLPSAMKVSASKTDLFLKDGDKTFMWFYRPYESFLKATYTSSVSVSSSIPNLKRVTTKQDLGNGFKVAYATTDRFLSNDTCANEEFGAVQSPCLTPVVTYSSSIGIFANCSAQSKYTPICDAIMKTIKIKDL